MAARPAAAASPLQGKSFSIDVFQGPILAPSDIIGIGGAYAGVAEGIAGLGVNAAAPAVREAYNVSYFNWDFSPSISIPFNLFGPRDDFNDTGANGQKYTDFIYATAGGLIQYGPIGFGLDAEIQSYSLSSTQVTLGKYHLLAAYRAMGDQVALGGGARATTLSLTPHDGEPSLTIIGAAPELGILVRPDWQSFRFGATLRFPVYGGRFVGRSATPQAGGLALPDNVVLPWEIELGAAVQVGPRPLNPVWIDPHEQEATLHRSFVRKRREREAAEIVELALIGDPQERAARLREIDAAEAAHRAQEERDEARIARGLEQERLDRAWNWPREHLLLTVELLVTGPVTNGVSIEGFLGQNDCTNSLGGISCQTLATVGSSGASVNYSPRVGVETEPIPGWMHTRAGTYYEPSRLGLPVGRQHLTLGADVRLFSTTWGGRVPTVTYKAQTYADFSPRYQSLSVGIGVWH
jgi:hypothetical protein